ncbi:MAG: alginate lyase family protein, partial [Bacteroidota bacterium]
AEDFGPTISWNRDYLSGREAPLDFGPTLDYRDPEKCGDIKYAWELNRHHHLVELAKAWYLTGDDAYAHEVTHQVDSWIDSSPYLYGINWASSLESAIRVINWCFCLSLLESGIGTVVKREFVKKWMASIHEHLMFISRNFSGYSSANNHLIGEASGLFVGAVSCRFAESRKWIRKSRQILEREVSRQNWPDGVNKEQALAYQAFVFDFLLLAGQLGGRNSVHFSKEYWSRLEKMAEFIHAMIDEDGEVPRIGDDDDGYVVRLSHRPDFRQFRSLLATSAILFGRRDFEAKSFGIDEKTFWLLGLTKTATPETAQETGDGTTSFPHGGYTILSGGGARLVFDSGPLGYLSLAAHGHADALSIVLNYDGRPFLVDPGTYAYHTRREWRDYFRGTSAHNTLVLDGEDQSLIGGNFMWSRKARCTLLDLGDRSVRASHDGYTRLRRPAIHERAVSFLSERNAFEMKDTIKGAGDHRVEQFFHFSPECACREENGAYVIENRGVRIRLVPDRQVSTRGVHTGETDPIRGWYSPGFDRKSPSPTLCCTLDIDGGAELITMIYLL